MGIYLNTNIASLNIQHTFTNTTDKLALAIERMTTGFRINCAADDAAGYSIANRMSTDLSSFQVASENAQMGSAMLSTAEGGLNIITNHLERIRDLAIQASNETYGTDARNAMQSEADARLEETQRILSTTEYNDKNIFAGEAGVIRTGKFIDDAVTYSAAEVAEMTALGSVSTSTTISTGKYSISTADELKQLATMVNNGKVTGGEFVLAADINFGHIDHWTPIGDGPAFRGTFDGNGHVVKNMRINNTSSYSETGLFGYTNGAIIKNVGVVNCNITGGYRAGGLIVESTDSRIYNCYAIGNITARHVGGLISQGYSNFVDNCYSDTTLTGASVGGLIGTSSDYLTNCFAKGTLTASEHAGGFISSSHGTIDECFSDCSINLGNNALGAGGFIYALNSGSIGNAWTSSKINCTNNIITGNSSGITNSTGSISSTSSTGSTGSFSSTGSIGSTGSTGSTGITYIGSAIGCRDNSSVINWLFYDEEINNTISCIGSGSSSGIRPNSIVSSVIPWIEDLTPKLAPSEGGGSITLQVGIGADDNSKMNLDFTFNLGSIALDLSSVQNARAAVQQIDELLSTVSQKKTVFGAAQNRLSSVLDALNVSIQNTTSALSTIRDADIATVSSSYIKNQILQQAASALLTSANQSPSIALQLI